MKKQVKDENFEVIECPEWNDNKELILDPGCYVLIRTYNKDIGVAICNYQHKILKEFRGKRAKDIWHKIFEYEKKWFTRKDHAAYLGKELNKAEESIKNNTEYIQE